MLADRIRELTEALVEGEPSQRSDTALRFRSRGSLQVWFAGEKQGKWKDHEDGEYGDALALVAHLLRCSMRDAYGWALDWLGFERDRQQTTREHSSAAPPLPSDRRAQAHGRGSIEMARRVWKEAVGAPGTLVESYLASRGLILPPCAPIRFHPACPRGTERLPAMLAVMSHPLTAEPCGVHRTFLARNGCGKAEGLAKMMLGHVGVIRLVPDEDVTQGLGLAEGIETSLSVMQVYGWSPMWAATSAGAIGNFPVLPGITSITVFSDNDENGAGLKAATKCYERWVGAGVEFVGIPCPRVGDWNDMARGLA
jgi:hypothetical protein